MKWGLSRPARNYCTAQYISVDLQQPRSAQSNTPSERFPTLARPAPLRLLSASGSPST